MFDIPFELFVTYIAIAFSFFTIGLIWSPKIPVLIMLSGLMIFPMVALTDNIIMGYYQSAEKNINLQELYHLHTWNADRELFATSNTIRAMHALEGSSLISEDFFDRIDCVQLFLKKTGLPTGTATIGSFDGNQVLIFTFGTIDVSTLTTSYLLYNFCPSAEFHHFIDTDSYIGIRYTGGDASNKIAVAVDNTNPIGDNILASRFAGADWVDEPTVDLAGVLYNRAQVLAFENLAIPYPFTEYPKIMFGMLAMGLVFIGMLVYKKEK